MTEFTPGTWADLKPTHPMQAPEIVNAIKAAAQAWRDYYDLVDKYYDKPGATTADVDYQALDQARDKAIQLDQDYERIYAAINSEHTMNPYDFFGLQ